MANTMSHYCFQLHHKIEKDDLAHKKVARDYEAAIKKIATHDAENAYKVKTSTNYWFIGFNQTCDFDLIYPK